MKLKLLALLFLFQSTEMVLAAPGEYQFYREQTAGLPMLIERVAPQQNYLLGFDELFSPVAIPKDFIVVNTDTELRTALLLTPAKTIFVDGLIQSGTYYEIGVDGTHIIGINGGTIKSTWDDVTAPLLEYNHCFFVNADNVTIENLRITSTEGENYGGFNTRHEDCVITGGSPIITGIADTTGLSANLRVSGRGILGYIVTVDSPTQITISLNAFANALPGGDRISIQKNTGLHYGISPAASVSYGIDNLTVRNCTFDNLFGCFYRSGGPTMVPSTNFRIQNCKMENFYGWGIIIDHQMEGIRIEGCEIMGRGNGATHAIQHNAIGLFNTHTDVRIANNDISHVDRMGIETAFTMDRVNISHNFVHNCSSFGISLGYSKHSQVNHNVVQDVGGIGIEIGGYYDGSVSRGRIRVIGNEVDGVIPEYSISSGMTIDQVGDVIISGNQIANIQPALLGFVASGIEVVNGAFEAHITSNVLRSAGLRNVVLNHTGPRNYVANNDFYIIAGDPDAAAVINYSAFNTVVNNRAYAPTGQNLIYYNGSGADVEYGEARFTSGTAYDGTNSRYDLTTGAFIAQETPLAVKGSAALDFPDTVTLVSADLTIAATGAAVDDPVFLSVPTASVVANAIYTAWVSAPDVVTVRFMNTSGGNLNPAPGTFNVEVSKR